MLPNSVHVAVSLYDFNSLCLYSFRYALGRMSYATSQVADFLLKHLPFLKDETIDIICREIKTAFETNNYGMEMDKVIWQKVLEEFKRKAPESLEKNSK